MTQVKRSVRRTLYRLHRIAHEHEYLARGRAFPPWTSVIVLGRLHPSGLNHEQRRQTKGMAKRREREQRSGTRGLWT